MRLRQKHEKKHKQSAQKRMCLSSYQLCSVLKVRVDLPMYMYMCGKSPRNQSGRQVWVWHITPTWGSSEYVSFILGRTEWTRRKENKKKKLYILNFRLLADYKASHHGLCSQWTKPLNSGSQYTLGICRQKSPEYPNGFPALHTKRYTRANPTSELVNQFATLAPLVYNIPTHTCARQGEMGRREKLRWNQQ